MSGNNTSYAVADKDFDPLNNGPTGGIPGVVLAGPQLCTKSH